MAITTFTGDLSAFFPAGTSLEARPASNWAVEKRPPAPGSTPPGSATDTATSAASGVVSFDGLADSTEYYVSDAVGTRYVQITTFPERQEVMSNQANVANGYPKLDANAKVPWALLAGGAINVKDAVYGAKGDSDATASVGTDDKAAIQAAINAASPGQKVFIPHGFYKLSGKLTVNTNGVEVCGEGGTELVLASGANSNVFRVNTTGDGTGATRLSGFQLRDLRIRMQGHLQANQGSGIEGCVVVFATDDPVIDNVYVKDPLNVGLSVIACKYAKVRGCTVENVRWGLSANGFNLQGTDTAAASDYTVQGCQVVGGCDVAFAVGSTNTDRISVTGCIAAGAVNQTTLTDGAITNGASVLTSASAAFVATDKGKMVRIAGAGAVGAALLARIASVDSATQVTIGAASGSATASTTVTGAQVVYGLMNSGVLAEGGGAVIGRRISITGCHVDTFWNVGAGFSEAGAGTSLKHEDCTLTGCTILNGQTGSTSIWLCSGSTTCQGNVVNGFVGDGIVVGAGNDYDIQGITVVGNAVKAAASATGSGVKLIQTGSFTNFLHGVVVKGNRLNGNAGGDRGVSILGKVRNVLVQGNSVTGWKNSGIVAIVSGGASPVDISIIGNGCRNNNQAANAAGVNSVGISIESACDAILLEGNRCTDDQGSKTQTHGIRWATGATNGVVVGNDCRGNLTAGFTSAFDAGTIARSNLGWSTISVSSASNVILPPGDLVRVNGTTQIDTFTVPPDGVVQTMRFAGSLTVKNSATLKLAGAADFSATADDCLTVSSDGTTLREVARSVN